MTTPAVFAITPNPALDITITLDELIPEATHRIDTALRKLGGKGVNVAAVAAEQGYPAYALGPVGARELADLEARTTGVVPLHPDVTCAFTTTPASLRATYAIHQKHTGTTTIINERGDAHPEPVYRGILADIDTLARKRPGSVVTLSGSFAPNTPTSFVTDLVNKAHAAGARVIVDSAGQPLKDACAAGADIVKPNAAELAETTGTTNIHDGAHQLLDLGARMVVVSNGPEGLLAVTPTSTVAAKLNTVLEGNPTGAGDALVAALATSLIDQLEPRDMLHRAVAWSAAAVLHPAAGTIGDEWKQLLNDVTYPNT